MYEEVLVGVGYLSIYVEVSIWWFFGAVAGGFLGFIAIFYTFDLTVCHR